MLFSSVVIAMVFAVQGVKHGFHCTGKRIVRNLGNSVYIIHSCDPPQILSLDRQTFVEGWTCKRNGKNIILR